MRSLATERGLNDALTPFPRPLPHSSQTWCVVCSQAHRITHPKRKNGKLIIYTFSAIPLAEGAAICAALPEGVQLPEGGPWKSPHDSCYVSAGQLLLHAPGQLPKTAGAELVACSKVYQALSTLKLKKGIERAAAAAAAAARRLATAGTASGSQVSSTTRGYGAVVKERDDVVKERDDLAAKVEDMEHEHQAELEVVLQKLHAMTSERDDLRDAVCREMEGMGVVMKESYGEALRRGQGLTLVLFSAQPEPLLTQSTPWTPPYTP